MENKVNKARLKEHLNSWIKVLSTKEHLDLFIKNNEKMSEEEKVAYVQLWEEAKGQEPVEAAEDNTPSFQEYWELEKAIEEEVVEEDTFVLSEEFRVASKKNKKNK